FISSVAAEDPNISVPSSASRWISSPVVMLRALTYQNSRTPFFHSGAIGLRTARCSSVLIMVLSKRRWRLSGSSMGPGGAGERHLDHLLSSTQGVTFSDRSSLILGRYLDVISRNQVISDCDSTKDVRN